MNPCSCIDMLVITIFVSVLLMAMVLYSLKSDPKAILGIYRQRGKWFWLKYVVFLGMYYYRKLLKNKEGAPSDMREAGRGVKAIADPIEMDQALVLSEDINAFDAVFFIAAKEGTNGQGIYFQIGCERRQMGICIGVFYLGLPGKGLLCCKKFPDTMMFGAEDGQFGAEGLLIKPVEAMKRWTVSYKGQAWLEGDRSKVFDVDFSGEWVADNDLYFDYDTDIHPAAVARAIATQPWSREYFDGLKKAHQSHYEQFGMLKAKFTVDGESSEVEMMCFRDHSFGHTRDWSLFHRYMLHNICLEDKTHISVGVVSYPKTSTSFEMGVVAYPSGELVATDWIDLRLYQHGERGNPPQDYAFQFKAGNKVYTVEVNVEYQTEHYKGWNWEARMVERFCRYVVNGVPGRGSNSLMYSHREGRPQHITDNYPEWFKSKLRTEFPEDGACRIF